MKALTFSAFGSSDVLKYIDVPLPDIKQGEVLVKTKAIGLNYDDIYRRKGNYHLQGNPPYIAGYEGAGIVVRSYTAKYSIGERVAFVDTPFGNAEYVMVPEEQVIPLPENIDFAMAASVLLQGLTAQYLSLDSHFIKQGEIILIHAAAGGVGQLLTQICKAKGATVIGLTRDATKIQTIINCKADHAIILDSDNQWKTQILALTNQMGVEVVYDSVGSTLADSFEVTRAGGQVVFYGMSGGEPMLVNPLMLMDSSKTLTGGDLSSFLTSAQERIRRANQLFEWLVKGDIKLKKAVRFKLSEGKEAHDYLESGKSSSKVLLIP
jgi:NADPH2:quinone reductase